MSESIPGLQIIGLGESQLNTSWVPGGTLLVPVYSYKIIDPRTHMGTEPGLDFVAHAFTTRNATEVHVVSEGTENFEPDGYADYVRQYGVQKHWLELVEDSILECKIPPIDHPSLYPEIIAKMLQLNVEIEDMHSTLDQQERQARQI